MKETEPVETKRMETLINGKKTLVKVPKDFETFEDCEEIRLEMWRAGALKVKHKNCFESNPCSLASCPTCTLRLRIELMNFIRKEKLHKSEWFFVTFTLLEEFRDPGDNKPYSEYKTNKHYKGVIQRLRRSKNKSNNNSPLRIIGGFEAHYKTVDNIPARRQLHVHCLISGLNEDEIRNSLAFIKNDLAPENTALFLTDMRLVGSNRNDFINTLSYSFKQPIVKHSFYNKDSRKPSHQPLTRKQILEVVNNNGVSRRCTERLILVGIRYEKNRFVLL